MEIANLQLRLRRASRADLPDVARLLHSTTYTHVHVDWRLPKYWIDTPGFVLAETTPEHVFGQGMVRACLAIGADPPPAAWVRVAALRTDTAAVPLLRAMLQAIRPHLAQQGVTQVGWLPRQGWPAEWLRALDFGQIDEVVTYVKPDLEIPPDVGRNGAVTVRQVRTSDLPALADIEAAAFDPLWRHSAESLTLGLRHSISFHVAQVGRQIVGFQYSAESDTAHAGHLVRLTVDPGAQRSGVGSILLRAALESYRQQNLREASLNTQVSNTASHRLYEKFGYERTGPRWPVWSLDLSPEIPDNGPHAD